MQPDCDQQVPGLAGHKNSATLGGARYKSKGVHHIGIAHCDCKGSSAPLSAPLIVISGLNLTTACTALLGRRAEKPQRLPLCSCQNAETQHSSSLQPGPKHGCRHPSIHMHCAPLGHAAARAACAPALFVRHQAAGIRSSWQPAYQGTLIHHPDSLTLTRSISAACRWSSCRAQRAPARLLACAAGGRPARAVRLAWGPAAHALLLHLRAVRPARRAGTLWAGATPCERRRAAQRCLARERRSAGPTHYCLNSPSWLTGYHHTAEGAIGLGPPVMLFIHSFTLVRLRLAAKTAWVCALPALAITCARPRRKSCLTRMRHQVGFEDS